MREIFKQHNMQKRAIWRRATKGFHNHNINIFMVLISYVKKGSTNQSGNNGGLQDVPHRFGDVAFFVAKGSMVFFLLSFGQDITLCLRHLQILTYLLTPWSRVLLEKLTGLQLVKKFPAFYGTRRFITVFTSARHLSLS